MPFSRTTYQAGNFWWKRLCHLLSSQQHMLSVRADYAIFSHSSQTSMECLRWMGTRMGTFLCCICDGLKYARRRLSFVSQTPQDCYRLWLRQFQARLRVVPHFFFRDSRALEIREPAGMRNLSLLNFTQFLPCWYHFEKGTSMTYK